MKSSLIRNVCKYRFEYAELGSDIQIVIAVIYHFIYILPINHTSWRAIQPKETIKTFNHFYKKYQNKTFTDNNFKKGVVLGLRTL